MARRLYRTQRSQHISNPSAPRLSSIDIFTGKVLIEEPLGRFVYHLQIPMSRFVEREESSSSFAIPYRRDGETLQGVFKMLFRVLVESLRRAEQGLSQRCMVTIHCFQKLEKVPEVHNQHFLLFSFFKRLPSVPCVKFI